MKRKPTAEDLKYVVLKFDEPINQLHIEAIADAFSATKSPHLVAIYRALEEEDSGYIAKVFEEEDG